MIIRLAAISALCAVLFSAGCVTQEARIATTDSGRPEVEIATTDPGRIKSLIIGDLVNLGYTVEQDTTYSLVLVRPLKGGEDTMAAMFVGNAYSSNRKRATYTFVRLENRIRVIGALTLEAQMPGGRINSVPLEDNGNTFNLIQRQLLKIRARIEQDSRSPAMP